MFKPAPANAATTASWKKAALRPLLASASILLAIAAAPAVAVDEHHPQAGAESMPPVSANVTQETGATVEKMQENVRRMQSQLERIASAKTDEERRAALADHMRTMQTNMTLGRSMMMGAHPTMEGGMMGPGAIGPGMMGPGMMSGMMCPGMMSPGMMGGPGMMGRGASGVPDSAELQRMERRLDMMQMMMEQMIRSRPDQSGTGPSLPAR